MHVPLISKAVVFSYESSIIGKLSELLSQLIISRSEHNVLLSSNVHALIVRSWYTWLRFVANSDAAKVKYLLSNVDLRLVLLLHDHYLFE